MRLCSVRESSSPLQKRRLSGKLYTTISLSDSTLIHTIELPSPTSQRSKNIQHRLKCHHQIPPPPEKFHQEQVCSTANSGIVPLIGINLRYLFIETITNRKLATVDVTTLSVPQLRQLQSRLNSELEQLTNSHAKLRAAQSKFRDCVRTINDGVVGRKTPQPQSADNSILVPLTSSLYVKGKLADREKVIVDVGTGFYVEKVSLPSKKRLFDL